MDAQIDRHQPLITARLVFEPKAFPPPPIISARMEFPSISIPQRYERSPTPEIRTRKRFSTPKRRYDTPKIMTPKRAATPTRHPTPIDSQKAVAFADVDSDSSLTSLATDSDPEEDGGVSTKIPKPPGMVGRPNSGGYNLQDKLGWNDATYQSIVSLVHKLAKTRLDTAKSYSAQDMRKIKQICYAVSKEYPILRDYMRDWPTRDMLILHLKYTSETGRRLAIASTAKEIEKIVASKAVATKAVATKLPSSRRQ